MSDADSNPMVGPTVVVGAVNVDLVVPAPRLPAPGETVVGGDLQRHGGGKGANAAVAAARIGAPVWLVGAVGADEMGSQALDELRDEGIDVSGVCALADASTGVALIVVDARGENQIAVGAGANARLDAEHTRSSLRAVLPGARCVLVSTEISDAAVAVAVEEACAAAIPCVLNPAPVTAAVLAVLGHGPILTPNASELMDLAASLSAPPVDDAPNQVAAAAALAPWVAGRTGAPVIVTLGGDGALIARPGEPVVAVAAVPGVEVRDTTGAGDTFNGVLAARLAGGAPLEEAVRYAGAAAAISVGSVGARAGMPRSAALE
ncbi:unannotated protein [freshwater metagenome]|uniref:Unannotated protein n=1 Tax=freshwater metagenome TaxID=449393 RepID=A0A6J7CNV5_9ZZZZ|nr:ribokinase [Actinomycetota bacterium]